VIRPARVVLWQHDPSTVREIVEALQLDYNTVSPLLKRLKTCGLLSRRRRADDERSVLIALTGEGRALREQARDIPETTGTAVGIDAATIATLQSILRRITTRASGATYSVPDTMIKTASVDIWRTTADTLRPRTGRIGGPCSRESEPDASRDR
jgi:DNA-binding MarR family transcriptional regulator